MSDNMTERVARALCRSYTEQFCSAWDKAAQDAHIAANAQFHRQNARAAIAAMREPTADMESAGEVHMESGLAVNVWESMIDAALR